VPASLDMSPYCYVRNLKVVKAPTVEVEREAFGRPGVAAPGLRADQVLGDLARVATEVIQKHPARNPDKPLFLYLPLTAPHKPVAPSARFRGKSVMGDYGDFIMEVDWVIGEVTTALERAGIAEDTLFIFTADNGASPNAAKVAIQKGHMPNWPYRGGKTTLWEGGHRVPFFARWPRRIRPGTVCEQTVCTVDLLATCADLVGDTLPQDAGEDSVSLLPALGLEPPAQPLRQTTIHHSIRGNFAIRRGSWKLITVSDGGGWGEKHEYGIPSVPMDESVPMQLYDLERDPGEKQNLYSENPEIVAELLAELTAQINRGRSTPGDPQSNDDDGPWEELTWMQPGEYTNQEVP
jgi:arylsulfatase A-like enzyme